MLSHVRNRLSVGSTRALLFLGAWSHNLVKAEDIITVTVLPDIKDGEVIKEDDELDFSIQ